MVNAINTGNFSLVSSFIIKDSPLYNSQQELIPNLQNQGIKEEFLGCEIKQITPISANTYDVSVLEKFNIQYADGSKNYKEFNYTYTALLSPFPGLSNIR